MGVGRKRTRDRHLPPRVYHRHGGYYFVDRDGKWNNLGSDYSDALKAYAALLGSAAPAATIEQLWSKYQTEVLLKKSAKTRRNREQEMGQVLKVFGRMQPGHVEPHHVWTYWRDRGEIEQARHEIRALSALLTFGRQCGAVKHENPCYALKLPGAQARERYVSDEEFLAVRDLAPSMIGYAMDLALIAGMDQQTIRRLERKNVTDDGLVFERRKTGKPQIIEWNDELRATIKAMLHEEPRARRYLICTRSGHAYSANGFQTAWQRLQVEAHRAGAITERYTFHDLRAKSASDDETDQGAADRLGHGDAALTRRVYRRLPRRGKALSILDKPG